MNIDFEYDYSEALKRQGHTQANVDAIRNLVSQYPHIPKCITDKQVRNCSEQAKLMVLR